MRTGIYPLEQYNSGLFKIFVNDPEDCYCDKEIFDRGGMTWTFLDKDRNISKCFLGDRLIIPLSCGILTEDKIKDTLQYSLDYMTEVQEEPLKYHIKLVLDEWTLYFPEPEMFGVIAYNLNNQAGFAFIPEGVKKIKLNST